MTEIVSDLPISPSPTAPFAIVPASLGYSSFGRDRRLSADYPTGGKSTVANGSGMYPATCGALLRRSSAVAHPQSPDVAAVRAAAERARRSAKPSTAK